ncbi:MAG TPA: Sec-independent protein translocase protein TatB [Pararhizobium sp.]|nr:Sec-independent protein translocase protein TatB [Pararhizobium sp.]
MFDVGWGELLVIAIVLIVVVGPKDLPRMLRAFGKTTAKMRAMAGEFRTQFDEALKDADLDEVRKTISDARSLNPTNSLREMMNPLRQVGDEIRTSLDDAVKPNSITKPDEDDAEVLSSIQVSEPAPLESEPVVADAAVPAKRTTRGKSTKAKTAKTGTARTRKPKASAGSATEPPAKAEAVPAKAPKKGTRKAAAKTTETAKPATNGSTKKASNRTATKASAAQGTDDTALKAASAARTAKPKTSARKTTAKAAAKPAAARTTGSPDPGLNGAGKTENT